MIQPFLFYLVYFVAIASNVIGFSMSLWGIFLAGELDRVEKTMYDKCSEVKGLRQQLMAARMELSKLKEKTDGEV